MKWKLKGKMLYSLSNAFLSIRGQWNGFFLFAYFRHFNIFLDIIFGSFPKMKKINNKIKCSSPILITKSRPPPPPPEKKSVLNFRPVAVVNASGKFYLIRSNYSFSFIILFVYEIGHSSYFLSCCRHTSGTVGEREIVTLASCQRFKMPTRQKIRKGTTLKEITWKLL